MTGFKIDCMKDVRDMPVSGCIFRESCLSYQTV
jgi:hypothetical protein